jgi:hypothetical protein
VANDNAAPVISRAEDDWNVAAIATRCLGMLAAPEQRMVHKQALERWGIASFVAGEVFTNEMSTVAQTVVAIEVVASWQRYWWRHHPKPKVQEQCLDAWLRNCDVLEEHERRTQSGNIAHT